MRRLHRICVAFICFIAGTISLCAQTQSRIYGKIISTENEIVDFASVYIQGTGIGCHTNSAGEYSLNVPAGECIVVVSAIGYETKEVTIKHTSGKETALNVVVSPKTTEIENVVVIANSVTRIRESAYNAIAIDAKSLHNTTLNLAGSLARVPGVKLRESGGVGSDAQFSLDGFSGKRIKFFLDGVPLDGAGESFGINNIPVNFAERIEVYKGVVPVGFGADAIGGVINIVTGNNRRTFVDASYSFGSFNTHRSYVNFGHTGKNGFLIELNAFQNYSDNNYKIQTSVVNFEWDENTGTWNQYSDDSKMETVKRFHDTYHNETVIGKVGLTGKSWADRFVLAVNLSQSDKEIQNGVRQGVVYGEKRRKAHSVMPSLEYRKRNIFTQGLDMSLTANYNYNMTHNIDTATHIFNWRGESIYNGGSIGEQSYQDSRFNNNNWNAVFNANYRLGLRHSIVLNHAFIAFDRNTISTPGTSSGAASSANFDKVSRKNITGLSYRFRNNDSWNLSVFGKYYNQYAKGPLNTSSTGGYNYEMASKSASGFGYGAAGTYFWHDFQVKLSYENALRLPTSDELFGDEDLEMGSVVLEPERSDNYNVSLSYAKTLGIHSIYVNAGFLYRDTRDYIIRNTPKMSGGVYYGSHVNFGRVKTDGINAEIQYGYSDWITIGLNLTSQNVRDYERYAEIATETLNHGYKARVPNIPYFFGGMDVSLCFSDLLHKGNTLTVTYDNLYVRNFPLYTSRYGSAASKKMVPTQFSHNISIGYSIRGGWYNFSVECRNLTNEKLYDNYSLQKAGRAFYGKIRYFFGK